MTEDYQDNNQPANGSRDEKRHCENNGTSTSDWKTFSVKNYSPRIAIYHRSDPDKTSEVSRTRRTPDLAELLIDTSQEKRRPPKLVLTARNIDLDGYVPSNLKSPNSGCGNKCSYKGNGTYCDQLALIVKELIEEYSRFPDHERPDLITLECPEMLCKINLIDTSKRELAPQQRQIRVQLYKQNF